MLLSNLEQVRNRAATIMMTTSHPPSEVTHISGDFVLRNRIIQNLGWISLCIGILSSFPNCEYAAASQKIDFEKQIAPLFVSHCLECHNAVEPEGGLTLTEAKLAFTGGESGKAILAGDSEGSLLWERVQADEMPPKHPLSDDEKRILKAWIEQGAEWPAGVIDPLGKSTATRAGRDFWSLQPLREVNPPEDIQPEWSRNAIDPFILKRLRHSGLTPSPEANARTLIRRLYFDLIGLPPTPEQVAAFIADPSEEAYQQIVTKLLDSSHYGERWGRHWLDVVRFGESDGFERNFQRENAWHYRDWVIDSLNADIPYDEFVRRQLIGDLEQSGIEGAASTGFWVAGVHNTVVGGSERMKLLARHDEIEEVLATVGQTFLGLTINCARCHDHKFDPVTQKEYYQFASAISGLGYGERVESIPDERKILAEIERKLAVVKSELSQIDEMTCLEILKERETNYDFIPVTPAPYARWEFDGNLLDSVGSLDGEAVGQVQFEEGALVLDGSIYVKTESFSHNISEKTLEVWVQLAVLDQRGGGAISIEKRDGSFFDAIVYGEQQSGHWLAGSNNFARTESFRGIQETEAVNRIVHVAIVYQEDGTIVGYRDGLPYGQPVKKSPIQKYAAEETEILFGLRHNPPGGNRFLKGKIHRAAFYDRALTAEEIAASAGRATDYVSETQIVDWLNEAQRQSRIQLKSKIAELTHEREQQFKITNQKIYTLTPRKGEVTKVYLRGDPANEGEVVSPAATEAIPVLSGSFDLPPDAPEAERRRKLAEWITDPANPLFARVIVNRVWHYHFGTGIVDTPNDFGFNGGRPSHPELLEYLALQFQQNEYRLKWLHRLIVTSSTYRQATYGKSLKEWEQAKKIDAGNRLLWRGSSRRVEAEILRDAILSVSGKLTAEQGGPSFKDVSVTLNSGTTYYEPIDVDGPEFWRRTIYRFNPRGGRSALLDTFDCPDPSATAPRRTVTTTPLQSLSLMYNVFVLRMADYFAERVESEAGENVEVQVEHAWQLAVSREPNSRELELSKQLVNNHGLSALCRGLFNLNEFVRID